MIGTQKLNSPERSSRVNFFNLYLFHYANLLKMNSLPTVWSTNRWTTIPTFR